MKHQELFETLLFLKEHRKLGSEADALVAPFEGTLCPLELRFESMSRTFANSYDESFEGGQTVVGGICGENLEFSLLLRPIDTEWAESLEKGEPFEGRVKFLGFDGLYQRGIFGYLGEVEVEEKDEATTDEPEGETDESVVEEDPEQDEAEPDEEAEDPGVLSSDEQPSQERETSSAEGQEAREEEGVEPGEVAEEEIQEDHSVKADADSEEVVQEPQEEASADKVEPSESHQAEVEEVSADFEKPNSESKPEEPDRANQSSLQLPATEEEELSPEEIRRVMDRGETWGVDGLSKKEQVIYRRESARAKADRLEVRRVLDKEFDKGIESLTDQERRVYDQEQARRSEWRRRNKKAKPKKPSQFRLFLAVMFLFLGLVFLGNGSASLFFFCCLLLAYVLHPWISFWMQEDPCVELFETRFLREKKFRRGAGLFLLSLCLFPSALVLAAPLFCFSIIKMHGSKTFEEFRKSLLK